MVLKEGLHLGSLWTTWERVRRSISNLRLTERSDNEWGPASCVFIKASVLLMGRDHELRNADDLLEVRKGKAKNSPPPEPPEGRPRTLDL